MKNIYLCGFMGCGKTTVGRQLAVNLSYRFVDLDAWIVETEGMEIAEIFASKGEPYFRQAEQNAIRLIGDQGNTVIATGGGAMVNAANAEAAKKNGIIVYLDVPFDVCYERIRGDAGRPLVQLNTREKLEQLYREREILYRAHANFSVQADRTPFACAREIIQQFRAYIPPMHADEPV